MERGLYLAMEGPSRAGKTTQIKLLVEHWARQYPDRELLVTREPGANHGQSETADIIRSIVQGEAFHGFQETMDPVAEACLYAASRAETLRTVVWPALERGCDVIADRCLASSLAFQGGGRGLGLELVSFINWAAIHDFGGYIRQRSDWAVHTEIGNVIHRLLYRRPTSETTKAYLWAACLAQSLRGSYSALEIIVHGPPVRSLLPDAVICLDIEPSEMGRRELDLKGDKFEGLDILFHARVREAYRKVGASQQFKAWRCVDGHGGGATREESVARVHQKIKEALAPHMP